MPQNTSPIFILTPKNGFGGNLTTGANSYDGTSGTVTTLFTAGSNGSFLKSIVLEAQGTNIATVYRCWLNNGSSAGTAANNSLFYTQALPATTATASGATSHIEIPINVAIAANYVVLNVLGTTVAAGWTITSVHGDY